MQVFTHFINPLQLTWLAWKYCTWEIFNKPQKQATAKAAKLQQKQPSYSKSSLDNFYHQHLAELSVNVYSYCLMVKVYLDVMCVEGGFSQIRSHNY